MTYDPVTYWSNRTDLKDQGSIDWVEAYIRKHTLPDKILDYGTGTGAKLHLFKGMKVTGVDIVDTYREKAIQTAKELGVKYDHVVTNDISIFDVFAFDTCLCSKVFLHIPPKNMYRILVDLKFAARKIIVWDIDRDDGAEHVFNHDFSKYFDMKDIIRKDGQILFHV